mmetsp:Transcript_5011/g.9434  ORF Transcript_5011/g.9434 Transcript_5011/m.9434 type:complete len:328 (-) Transcript_5011:59-1042(-)
MARHKLLDELDAKLPSFDGKVFAITGTTSGTGYEAARTAAKHGGKVLLLNRNSSRSEESLKRLKEAVPSGQFVPIECDLQDFSSVKRAAEQIKNDHNKLYCLGNNAGIMAAPDKATKDGYDTQMQTNHLSHFMLTAALYPLLEAQAQETGDARVVNHSSFGRLMTKNKKLESEYLGKNGGNLGGDKLKFLKGPCFERYFQTKLANSVFTVGLHQKLQARNSKVRAIAAHPGGSNTNLSDSLDFGFFINTGLKITMPFLGQSPGDGAVGFVKAMMDPDAESGALYGPKDGGMKGRAVPNKLEPYETDSEQIEMLWKESEKAISATFDL